MPQYNPTAKFTQQQQASSSLNQGQSRATMPQKQKNVQLRTRNYHEKTSYNIMPTPPSPTRSGESSSQPSSMITTSNSNSNSTTSSSSPPLLQTPPRSRGPTRYPSLGHVPLHRRGTSNTYERLEDLLRDAGYKETRIFTPEADRERDRDESSSSERAAANRQSTVGAVVGFLTALIPNRTSSVQPDTEEEATAKEYSPPASPLANKHRMQSTVSLRREQDNTVHHPQPSRAGAYLRHMASAPNMPKRPQSNPTFERKPNARRIVISNNRNESDAEETQAGSSSILQAYQPPLPPSWFESVARAVMTGGGASYIGGPRPVTAPGHKSNSNHKSQLSPLKTEAVHTLRQTRSSLSQPQALSDHTNTNNRVKPNSILKLQVVGKAEMSESTISRTRVICRSAPVSRAGSPVRKEPSKRGRNPKRRKSGAKKDNNDALPSLARTKAEGDSFQGWKGLALSVNANSASSSEEEDDGELDLARMLVPPKRQNSIRSLRKHLQAEQSQPQHSQQIITRANSSGRDSRQTGSAQNKWSEEEGYGGGWERNLHDSDEEEFARNTQPAFAFNNNTAKSSATGSFGRPVSRPARAKIPGNWN